MRYLQKLFIVLIAILLTESTFAQRTMNIQYDTATFGTGCFWCTEAIFDRVEGVVTALPGYSGGTIPNPDYELVCTGKSGYAEVIQIVYQPDIIGYNELLEIFWQTHDPTTLNRQGADVGTQYRSVIFYHNAGQKKLADYYKEELEKSKIWDKPIVTEISPFVKFYKAESYHIDYYKNNPSNSYCNYVITPKIEKFEKVFSEKMKKE